jgi:hypothetical protein
MTYQCATERQDLYMNTGVAQAFQGCSPLSSGPSIRGKETYSE